MIPISTWDRFLASTPLDDPLPPKMRSTLPKTMGMAKSRITWPFVGPRVNW